jgi:hypothetical protein
VACCLLKWLAILMKPPESNPHFSPNWAWPEKTWFRERLNALKAKEQETQRKPASSSPTPAAVDRKRDGDKPLGEDDTGTDL